MKVADSVPGPQGKASVTTRIVEMTLILQRVALASSVYSTMLQRKVSPVLFARRPPHALTCFRFVRVILLAH